MTLPLQDPLLSAEGQGQPSHRTGFFRSLLKERKAAVIGLSIIVFFVVLLADAIGPLRLRRRTLTELRGRLKREGAKAASSTGNGA